MPPALARAPCDWSAILRLIQTEFAYMDGVIDPPSSMHRLGVEDIARQASEGEVWVIGAPPVACAFFTVKDDALYVGKLAVDAAHRGQGHARALLDMADRRAAAQGLRWLELQTRIELGANHAAFRRLGFHETGRTAHPGYARPTSVTMRRAVAL
ncbi:MAG: GNAT family N-acetyltransferase [Gemmobacter sp.]|nr:GNAT family N-acetyltransferase [Gemmobacter sp.]